MTGTPIASLAHCAGCGRDHAEAKTPDLVDAAVGAGSFATLVAVAKAAGLVDTVKGDGLPAATGKVTGGDRMNFQRSRDRTA